MAVPGPSGEDRSVPLHAFAFHVSFKLGAFAKIDKPLLGGFTDVAGLEATMEPKVIKAGGVNYGPVQRAGPVSFATVVLKRGIVESRHLWQWWASFAGADGGNGAWAPSNRAEVTIAMLRQGKPIFGWTLKRAMPIKFRAGDLKALSDEFAVEEIHLAHEGLKMEAAA